MLRRILCYDTLQKQELRPITEDLTALIRKSGLETGTLLAYSLHTTMGLVIQEVSEPNLCEDLVDYLVQSVEDDGRKYRHTCALHPSGVCQEDRYNGPSHVRQMLVNQSIVLDFCEGRLSLGRWQDVALMELDGPRQRRQVLVKLWPDPVPGARAEMPSLAVARVADEILGT
jgi:secondary thiamine-phosphate synthase enzyme